MCVYVYVHQVIRQTLQVFISEREKMGGMMQTKTNKHNFSAKENATNVTLSQRNVVSKT